MMSIAHIVMFTHKKRHQKILFIISYAELKDYIDHNKWCKKCSKFGWQLLNFLATLEQLLLDLLAQSIHAYLGAQEKTDCTSMLWSIDSCQNKVSADQYHLTVWRAQVSTHRGRVLFEVIRWQVTSFQMIASSILFFKKFILNMLCLCLCLCLWPCTITILISN